MTEFIVYIFISYILSRIFHQIIFNYSLKNNISDYCILKYLDIGQSFTRSLDYLSPSERENLTLSQISKKSEEFLEENSDLFSYNIVYYKIMGFTPHFSNQVFFFFLKVFFEWDSAKYILDNEYFNEINEYVNKNRVKLLGI